LRPGQLSQKTEDKWEDSDRDDWKMWGTERRDTGRKQITEKLTSVLKEAKVVT
jgi:hypothetical protein